MNNCVFRFDYNENNINWADVIFSVGGDGTFLLAASKIQDNTIPVIGFNSDPYRSEGYLCISKKYNFLVEDAINKILSVSTVKAMQIFLTFLCDKSYFFIKFYVDGP